MTPRRQVAVGVIVAALVLVPAACRPGDDDVATPTAPAESLVTTLVDGTLVDGTTADAPTITSAPSGGPASPLPDVGGVDADASDGWVVDTPGASTVVAIDDGAVLEIDPRGTHEWVRATNAISASDDDVGLVVRFETPGPLEGSLFVGVRGDGEWTDTAPYQQQAGVAVEYGFAALHDGEVTLIVADGPEATRIGPVLGPVLDAGDVAVVRLQVVDDLAQVRVWVESESEPSAWALEADLASEDGAGTVHLSFRGAVGEQVAILDVRLEPPVP